MAGPLNMKARMFQSGFIVFFLFFFSGSSAVSRDVDNWEKESAHFVEQLEKEYIDCDDLVRKFYDRTMELAHFTFIGEVVWAEPKPDRYIECGLGVGHRWVRFRIVEALSGSRKPSFKEGLNLEVKFMWCWEFVDEDNFKPGARFVVGAGKCENGVCEPSYLGENKYVKVTEENKKEIETVRNCVHKFDQIK